MRTYSDAELLEDLTSDNDGDRHAAPYLVDVPQEVRSDIVRDAYTITNIVKGTRYSSAVAQAVATWKRSGKFPYSVRSNALRVLAASQS